MGRLTLPEISHLGGTIKVTRVATKSQAKTGRRRFDPAPTAAVVTVSFSVVPAGAGAVVASTR
jgi:hypothetical protein